MSERSRIPPTLLSLSIDSALQNLSRFSDLSPLPDHIILELFLKTLRAGKLNEKNLTLFLSSGKDEVLELICSLNIQPVILPVYPTNLAFFCILQGALVDSTGRNFFSLLKLHLAPSAQTQSQRSSSVNSFSSAEKMSLTPISDDEVDIVIAALRADLASFLNEWKPFFSRFHLIVVKDPDLKQELKIPDGFNVDVYTKSDIDQIVGSTSISFSGYSCRYFGFLISKRKYIISIDDDCVPAKDNDGVPIDAVAHHISNLSSPATPFFFNTLYDPFCKGADFVRGYPFSLRSGVTCALSCGLWLNLADLDAPTQSLKPELRNTRYVDAVLTVPARAMMPLSGINIAFNREAVGPALVPALKLAGEGKVRWETIEDIWCGMCVKVVCDHLSLGVKSGLPYVWREERGNAVESLKKEWEGVKLMEEVVPLFQSMRLPKTADTAAVCVTEMAEIVKRQLGQTHPVFARAADGMLEWIRVWKAVGSRSTGK